MTFDSINPNAGMPGFDSNGNPMSYGVNGSTTPGVSVATQVVNPQPAANPVNPAQDYLSQQQALLSKYQAMAQRAYPSNPLFGNSAFAQNHPGIAGALGNAFLTASMIRPGRTVGESISNVAGGLIGANQWQAQQALRQQMMPIEMMNQNLGMQKNIADINELNARSQYYGQEGAWRASEIAKAGFPRAISGPKVDDQGHQWQTVMDPATGAVNDKPVGWTPQEGYQPTFKNEEKNQRMSTPGGLEGEIMGNLMSSDPALQAMGKQQRDIYVGMAGARAAATTGGQQNAPHPQQDYDTFMKQQQQGLFNDIQKPEMDYSKWYTNKLFENSKDPMLTNPGAAEAAHQKEVTDYQNQLMNRKSNFARYSQTPEARKGVEFDPDKVYTAPNSKAPAANPTRKNPFAPAQ